MSITVRLKTDALEEWMVRSGLSQNALAEKVGISSGYASQLLDGARRPGARLRQSLQDVTGLTWDDLYEKESGNGQAPRRRDALSRHVAEAIRRLRTGAGLTQEQLADRVRVQRTTLANIENGRQGVMLDLLYGVAAALGVEARDLLPTHQELRHPPVAEVCLPGGETLRVRVSDLAALRKLAVDTGVETKENEQCENPT